MNTRTKLAMLAILSVAMLTAITMTSVTSLITPVFAKKKHCDKSDSECDTITAKNDENLLTANDSSVQSDQVQNDSNIIDEDEESNSDGFQTEVDNSTSSTNLQSGDPFSLAGM